MLELIDFLSREDVKQIIKEYAQSEPTKLLLNPPAGFKDRIKEIVDQIIARQKAKGKLHQWASNYELIMPPPLSIEQASSDATCSYKKNLVSGDHFIDLTGGMGIDFLTMSENFANATYVERSEKLCAVFQHNAKVLRRNVKIVNNDASNFITNVDTPFDQTTIYLDPARRDLNSSRVVQIQDCSPNVMNLLPQLQSKASRVIIKYAPLLDIQAAIRILPGVKEVHIVSIKNECKELLFLIDWSFKETPLIKCMNLDTDQPSYSFKLTDEQATEATLANIKEYLHEPNSSIMKAGAFKKIANDFSLEKLAQNTHLYTSKNQIADFPGRTFKILDNGDKSSIKHYAPENKINVIARNYPMSATELKKKWKLKDGGDYFLIGFKNKENKSNLVIAKRVHSLE